MVKEPPLTVRLRVPKDFMNLVPSSKANPPMPFPKYQTYSISVQRRESNNSGRWREIATWNVTTSEDDMHGPLNCGLRQNYRIVINQLSDTIPLKDLHNARPSEPDNPHLLDPRLSDGIGETR